MSIIYEALKKTQQKREVIHNTAAIQAVTAKAFPRLTTSLLIAGIMLTTGALVYSKLTALFFEKPKTAVTLTRSPAQFAQSSKTGAPIHPIAGRFNLNGVLLSEQEKIAIINNKSFHVGDTLDNMKIIAIEENKVSLQDESGIVEIKGKG